MWEADYGKQKSTSINAAEGPLENCRPVQDVLNILAGESWDRLQQIIVILDRTEVAIQNERKVVLQSLRI